MKLNREILHEPTADQIEIREDGFDVNTNNMSVNKKFKFDFDGQKFVVWHSGYGSVRMHLRYELLCAIKAWITNPVEFIRDMKGIRQRCRDRELERSGQ